MAHNTVTNITRRGLLRVFAATALTAVPTYSNAFFFSRGSGDIRRVKMYSTRTAEKID
ncbi:MAG: Tat pathway signal protein, partial [Pseudomonadota bacterium]